MVSKCILVPFCILIIQSPKSHLAMPLLTTDLIRDRYERHATHFTITSNIGDPKFHISQFRRTLESIDLGTVQSAVPSSS